MSFFNFGRKNNTNQNIESMNVAKQEVPSQEPVLNLRKEQAVEQLNLRKEVFAVSLRKNNLSNVKARVAVVLDKSGSMQNLYESGFVQKTIERLLPIALKFDDDGELDVWLFANKSKRVDGINEQDFFGYIDREVLGNRANNFWGGTDYAPVMKDVLKKYTREEPSTLPTYVIFITDGDNFDKPAAERMIKKASEYNIFWQFVGIGNSHFDFLKRLDDMDGRFIDNANFFEIKDLNKVSDLDLYNKLFDEYPDWEKEARKKGLIN